MAQAISSEEDRLLRVATCMAGMKYTASMTPLLSISRLFRHDKQLWWLAKDFYSPLSQGSRLTFAAHSGDLARTRFLLSVQASQAAPLLTTPHAWAYAPLIWACSKGHTEVALELLASDASGLEKAAEYNVLREGFTPLLMACSRGHTALALALIERGADVHALSAHGATSLALASYGGHIEIVRAVRQGRAGELCRAQRLLQGHDAADAGQQQWPPASGRLPPRAQGLGECPGPLQQRWDSAGTHCCKLRWPRARGAGPVR